MQVAWGVVEALDWLVPGCHDNDLDRQRSLCYPISVDVMLRKCEGVNNEVTSLARLLTIMGALVRLLYFHCVVETV